MLPGFISSPTLPNSTTHQSTTNYLLPPPPPPPLASPVVPLKLTNSTLFRQPQLVNFFRATEGPQVPNITNDRNAELPIKSCNEAGVASNSHIKPHFLNVKPAKPSSSDDCYCFIFMNIAHLYSKTKQKVTFITDLCNHNTLFLCSCETYLNDNILGPVRYKYQDFH